MTRAKSDVSAVGSRLIDDMTAVRAALLPLMQAGHGEPLREAWEGMETFCAVALRVLSKTNPSKLAAEVQTVEIMALMPRYPAKK